jgi:hypothetical protein
MRAKRLDGNLVEEKNFFQSAFMANAYMRQTRYSDSFRRSFFIKFAFPDFEECRILKQQPIIFSMLSKTNSSLSFDRRLRWLRQHASSTVQLLEHVRSSSSSRQSRSDQPVQIPCHIVTRTRTWQGLGSHYWANGHTDVCRRQIISHQGGRMM